MEIEKLIKHMREEAQDYRSGRTLGRAFSDAEDVLDEAATALSTLQAENEKLRTELERMKKIMRDNGIMTIPPKYPGWPTEWCGAPMTDEAVDMVMERLEALYEEN